VNWRAFGLGAAVAAVVAIAVIAVILVLDESDEPSLGTPATTEAARVGSSATGPDGPVTTSAPLEPLPLDVERLLADPCAVLTADLRDAFALTDAPRADGERRCVVGSGAGALEVELKPETSDPFSVSAEFQVRYGDELRPLEGLAVLAFHIRQGERTLVTVFSTGLSVWFLVPTLEIDRTLAGELRAALE
jgi:hypothetical protein